MSTLLLTLFFMKRLPIYIYFLVNEPVTIFFKTVPFGSVMYMHPSPSTTHFVRPLLLVIATTKICKKSEFEEINDEGMTQEKQEVQKNAVARRLQKDMNSGYLQSFVPLVSLVSCHFCWICC